MDKRSRVVLYVCLVGMVIRVVYMTFFNAEIRFPDEERFLNEARSLLEEGVFRANGEYAHDMPLTGFFLAFGLLLTGGSIPGVKLLMISVSAVTIWLIGILAYRIYPGRHAMLIAVVVSAVYPFFIFYSSLLLSETIFMFFVVAFFVQIASNNGEGYWKSGLIAGMAHLTRPTMFYFLPVVWIWDYLLRGISTRSVIVAALGFTILVIPWAARNAYTLGEFHLTTAGSGQVLWEGNNPWNTTGGVSGTFSQDEEYLDDLPSGLNELEADEWKKKKALEFIQENPERFLRLSMQRFIRFWNLWPNSEEYQEQKYKIVSILSFSSVLVLSMVSLVVLRSRIRLLGLLLAFILYYTLIHVITIGSIRYRLPLEPILIALASAGVSRIADIALGKRRNTLAQ